jgi:phage host-nuclease inhibitor protein Gam
MKSGKGKVKRVQSALDWWCQEDANTFAKRWTTKTVQYVTKTVSRRHEK